MMKKFALGVSGLVMVCGPVLAQDAVPLSVEIDGSVSAYVESMSDGTMDVQTLLAIKALAHQKAVAITCDAFDVDDAKMQAALLTIYPPAETFDALSEDDQFKINSLTMLSLGTFLGAHLAVAETDKDGFCANAETERADATATNLIWAAKQ